MLLFIAKESSQIGELKVFSYLIFRFSLFPIAKESSQIGELKVLDRTKEKPLGDYIAKESSQIGELKETIKMPLYLVNTPSQKRVLR